MKVRWDRGSMAAASIMTMAFSTAAIAQQPAEAPETSDPVDAEPSEGPSGSFSASTSLDSDEGAQIEANDATHFGASAPTAATAEVPAYAGARADTDRYSVSRRYAELPYLERYKPERNLWEIGMFMGVLFPSPDHNLKVAVLPREEYSTAAFQLGGRFAFYPLTWAGAEVEGYGGGGSTKTSGYSSVFYSVRAHAILQLPFWSITPFALVGGGMMGAATETMGHDRDPAFHFGAGVKIPVNHRVSARFDVRDTLTQKGDGADQGKQTHHPELHLGATFTFERTPPPMPLDTDYDGLFDSEDSCPNEGALTIDGCPTDSDQDGIYDAQDQCPVEAGPAPTGCPDKDTDGDGVPVPADQCPDEPGPAPSGCPDKDEDGDGFIGDADKCPKAPETRNGFEDDDGCPDEMPEAMKRFTGVIKGINFKQGTSEIETSSYPTLDSAVEILKQYPSIRMEVSGHTSSEGTDERNQELSVERATSVKTYFESKGIGGDRIVARGAGPSEPIADNATKEGREQNRRIEFRILSQP